MIYSPPPTTGKSIFPGTFTFTAGTVAGEVTYLRATVDDPLFTTTLSAVTFTEFDGMISDGISQVTVTSNTPARPELSTFTLLGIGGLALVACNIRSKRQQAA